MLREFERLYPHPGGSKTVGDADKEDGCRQTKTRTKHGKAANAQQPESMPMSSSTATSSGSPPPEARAMNSSAAASSFDAACAYLAGMEAGLVLAGQAYSGSPAAASWGIQPHDTWEMWPATSYSWNEYDVVQPATGYSWPHANGKAAVLELLPTSAAAAGYSRPSLVPTCQCQCHWK